MLNDLAMVNFSLDPEKERKMELLVNAEKDLFDPNKKPENIYEDVTNLCKELNMMLD